MLKIEIVGIPARRGAREWAIDYEGVIYPCKLLISWGNSYANGEELDPDPNNFNTYDAQEYLLNKDFIITALRVLIVKSLFLFSSSSIYNNYYFLLLNQK